MLGFLFALFAVTASIGMGNMTQSNSIADALWVAFSIPKAKTGLYLTVLTVLVVIGGIGVIGKVTQVLVPFMGVFYLCGAFVVILVHWRNVPVAVGGILTAAFCPQAVSGGIFGSVTATMFQSLRWGVSRGIFSNEAGLGSAPMAHAAADAPPVEQGFFGMLEVFVDTVVVCTLSALVILLGVGVENVPYGTAQGALLTEAGFQAVLGEKAPAVLMAVCLTLFAVSTLLTWGLYGSRCAAFLLGERAGEVYQVLFAGAAVLGGVLELEAVWHAADTLSGLMALPNLTALLLLSPEAARLTREYFRQRN